MAKKHSESSTSAPVAENPATESATPATAADSTTTALAKSAAATLAPAETEPVEVDMTKVDPNVINALPGALKLSALRLKRPDDTELGNIIAGLPADVQTNVIALMERANPEKVGVHGGQTGYKPTIVKLFQGTGNDPARPRKISNGEYFTADSRNLGESFVGAIVGIHMGRLKWENPNEVSGAPQCASEDGVLGFRFGQCAACPYSRDIGKNGGCDQVVTAYVIPDTMDAVLEMRFTKSSFKTGKTLMAIIKNSSPIWGKWFKFSSLPQENKEKKTITYAAQAQVDVSKEPVNAKVTPLFEAFTRLLDADVYYPSVARIYQRYAAGDAALPAGTTEAAAVDAAMASSAVPDYTQDV